VETLAMRIVLLPSPEGNVIAREEQFGRLEAEFVMSPNEEVLYRHPWDSRSWFVGRDPAVFRQAATAWNRYCEEGQKCQTDEEGAEAVGWLRAELLRLGVLEDRSDNLWTSLLEQAEDGLM
jgi:hypothetical protein